MLSGGSLVNNLSSDYDTVDPGARVVIQQIVEQANGGVTDLLRKPWGVCAISRVSRTSYRKNTTALERESERKKIEVAVILEWQPGPVEALAPNQALPVAPAVLSAIINGQRANGPQIHSP